MKYLVLVFLLAFSISTYGQAKTWDRIIEKLDSTSTLYLNSFIQKDWDTYTSHTHPNILEMAGGKELIIQVANETIEMYSAIGYDLKAGRTTGTIETVDSEEGIQAIIPASIEMKAANGDIVDTPMKLFAISSDAGETWKFVDLSQYDQESIKSFVPEFNEALLDFWK